MNRDGSDNDPRAVPRRSVPTEMTAPEPLEEGPSAEDRLLDSLATAGVIHGPISPEKHAEIHRIVQDFMDEVARETREKTAPRKARRVSRPKLLFTFLLVTASIFVWVAQPTAPAEEIPPPSVVVQEASLRFAMYLKRARIEEYRQLNGRFPVSMDEADGIGYRLITDRTYELSGTTGAVSLLLKSSESPDEFLGTSIGTLLRRQRRGP